MNANKGAFETLISGADELAENIVKLRLARSPEVVTAIRNRRVKLLEEEVLARLEFTAPHVAPLSLLFAMSASYS
jgi:hypothetical protein